MNIRYTVVGPIISKQDLLGSAAREREREAELWHAIGFLE